MAKTRLGQAAIGVRPYAADAFAGKAEAVFVISLARLSTVQFENRTAFVPFANRTTTVAFEDRTTVVPPEDRTTTVPFARS